MNFQEYRELALKTASKKSPAVYYAMGVAGEAGEVIDAVKKLVRDCYNGTSISDAIKGRIDRIKDEIGDLMWYLAVLYGKYIHKEYAFSKVKLQGEVKLRSVVGCLPDISRHATRILHEEVLAHSLDCEVRPLICSLNLYEMLSAVNSLCYSLGIDVEDVLEQNIKKLSERYPEGFKVGVK